MNSSCGLIMTGASMWVAKPRASAWPGTKLGLSDMIRTGMMCAEFSLICVGPAIRQTLQPLPWENGGWLEFRKCDSIFLTFCRICNSSNRARSSAKVGSRLAWSNRHRFFFSSTIFAFASNPPNLSKSFITSSPS